MTDIGESESAVFSPPRSSLVLHGEGPGVGALRGVSETAEASAPPPTPSPQEEGRGIGERLPPSRFFTGRGRGSSRAATETVA